MDVQERLNVKVIGSQDDLEEHLLVNSDKPVVPFANIGRPPSVPVDSRQRLATMVLAVLQNLRQNAIRCVPLHATQKLPTFFSTDEETLCNGIGSSLSPRSVGGQSGQI